MYQYNTLQPNTFFSLQIYGYKLLDVSLSYEELIKKSDERCMREGEVPEGKERERKTQPGGTEGKEEEKKTTLHEENEARTEGSRKVPSGREVGRRTPPEGREGK